jgi:hypothetical protein
MGMAGFAAKPRPHRSHYRPKSRFSLLFFALGQRNLGDHGTVKLAE